MPLCIHLLCNQSRGCTSVDWSKNSCVFAATVTLRSGCSESDLTLVSISCAINAVVTHLSVCLNRGVCVSLWPPFFFCMFGATSSTVGVPPEFSEAHQNG